MFRLLLTLGIGLPILGGVFAWHGFKERDIAQASSDTPDTLPLSQLIARGPDGNANVVVTDYVALRPHVVHRGKRGRWSGAWVAVVPKDDAPPGGSPRAVQAFVFSGARDPDAVYQRLSSPQLTGMVSNRILTPNDSETDELRGLFPQTDFSTCVYIHEGREPASAEKSALMIFGGLGAAALGFGSLMLALVVWRKGAAEDARRRQRSKGPLRGDEDDRPRKRRAAADDEDDDRPRRRSRRDDD